MYPPALQKFGLWEALKELLHNIDQSKSVTTSVSCIPEHLRLDADSELAIFRVMQELVTNSLRHSGANAINIEIRNTQQAISIHYIDNGKGMDEKDMKSGLGFLNMRSRIEAIDGSIHFESSLGNGTKTTLEIKL
jgi:signal transduction histidine kinase